MEAIFTFLGGITPMEIVIVGVIAALLFGKPLPGLTQDLTRHLKVIEKRSNKGTTSNPQPATTDPGEL